MYLFKIANMILKNMDTNMSPCHDFYAYACGNFAEHYPIPSTHDVITQENDRITEIKHEFIGIFNLIHYIIYSVILKLNSLKK